MASGKFLEAWAETCTVNTSDGEGRGEAPPRPYKPQTMFFWSAGVLPAITRGPVVCVPVGKPFSGMLFGFRGGMCFLFKKVLMVLFIGQVFSHEVGDGIKQFCQFPIR